jgi:hypothetical protein
MNKILTDGRRVVAYNRRPKFFDISFVTIGAEKASHILKKVASANPQEAIQAMQSSAALGEIFYQKFARAEKEAAQNKRAEIEKDVPSQPAANIQPATPADKAKVNHFLQAAGEMKSQECPIPNGALDHMAQHPMKDIFTTLAALGIDLRPNEFQRIALVKQGAVKLADALERHRLVFDETKPSSTIPKWAMDFRKFDHDAINEKIAMIIRPWIQDRSCYPDILLQRAQMMKRAELDFQYDKNSQWYPMTDDQRRKASGMHGLIPASAALATGFMVFRKIFPGLKTTGPAPLQALAKHPWLLPMLIGAGVGASVGLQVMTEPMPLTKKGSVRGLDAKKRAAYHGVNHGMVTLAYVYSQSQSCKPQQISGQYDRLIAQVPELVGLAKVANESIASEGAYLFNAIRRIERRN